VCSSDLTRPMLMLTFEIHMVLSGIDASDNVRGLKDGGVRDFLPSALLVGAVVHIRLHGDSFVEALMRVQWLSNHRLYQPIRNI